MAWEIEHRRNGFVRVRVFLGIFCLLVAAISLEKRGARNVEWITYVCLGGFWLLFAERRDDEAWAAFLQKPRTLVLALLALASVAGLSYNVFILLK
jgi:hypothetical protein